jgi:hypothetical protein
MSKTYTGLTAKHAIEMIRQDRLEYLLYKPIYDIDAINSFILPLPGKLARRGIKFYLNETMSDTNTIDMDETLYRIVTDTRQPQVEAIRPLCRFCGLKCLKKS